MLTAEKIQEIADGCEGVTEGPWSVWTSNSFRRISAKGDGDVVCGDIQRSDGHPDLLAKPKTLDHIARLDPTTVRALCALALDGLRMREALTPSADTKVAYIGEFTTPLEVPNGEGDYKTLNVAVSWTTTKAIMAAIMARATIAKDKPND